MRHHFGNLLVSLRIGKCWCLLQYIHYFTLRCVFFPHLMYLFFSVTAGETGACSVAPSVKCLPVRKIQLEKIAGELAFFIAFILL